MELRMMMDALDVHLHISECLAVTVDIPLPKSDPQLFRPGRRLCHLNSK